MSLVVLRVARRPARAMRALAWLALEGRSEELVVIDDARDGANPGVHPRWLPAGARYLDRAAREGFADRLGGGSLALRRLARYAVLGPEGATFTPGAAANTALLLGVDRRVWMMDDDVLPLAVAARPGRVGPPGDPTALEVFAGPRDLWPGVRPQRGVLGELFDRRQEPPVRDFGVVGALPDGPQDQPVRARGVVEGLSDGPKDRPAPALGGSDGRQEARALALGVVEGLSDGPQEPPVRAFGVVGDSAARSPVTALFRGGAWLAELAPDWPARRTSRTVFRAAPSPAPGRHLTSHCLQLDLRVPLPPFLPALRNSDGLWGEALARSGQPAWHMPWAVVHAPSPREAAWSDVLDDLVQPRAADLLAMALQLTGPTEPPFAAVIDPRAGPSRLRPAWRGHVERVAIRLDDARRLAPPGAAQFHRDVEAALRRLVTAGRAVPPPVDLGAEPWARLGALARTQAELIDAWPQLWDRASSSQA